jgi:L-ascorbate metabolism protein UlaG (beta-lactamase superfamily)
VARNAFHADIILLTHDHYDHCSPADIDKLRGPETVVIGNSMVGKVLSGVAELRPWQTMNIDRVSIRAVPAYNSHHPKEFGGLGYVVTLDQQDIYFAGDTDLIEEMANIRPDVAILPIGGRQTMDVNNAVEAVRRLRPRWVLPSHWGNASEGGSNLDARLFAEYVQREKLAEVIIPEQK